LNARQVLSVGHVSPLETTPPLRKKIACFVRHSPSSLCPKELSPFPLLIIRLEVPQARTLYLPPSFPPYGDSIPSFSFCRSGQGTQHQSFMKWPSRKSLFTSYAVPLIPPSFCLSLAKFMCRSRALTKFLNSPCGYSS